MSEFKIDVDSFYWIDSDDANTGDLCLHGHVRVQIGSYQSEDYGTVSASALYLLKTLSRNHIPESEIQLVPCCGHSMFAISSLESNPEAEDDYGELCKIWGCPNGLDWTVKHEGDFVRLISDSGQTVCLPFEEYKAEVFAFSNKVKAFYDSSLPRDVSNYDAVDIEGFKAFCAEWKMHYEKWGFTFGKEISLSKTEVREAKGQGGMKMEKSKTKLKVGVLNIIAVFAVMIAYSIIMDYLHYAFLEHHKEILGYYYNSNYLILPALILFFVSIRLFVFKSLLFKKLHIAANIAIFTLLAFLFFSFSASAFDSAHLTKDGVKTYFAEYDAGSIAAAKIGIRKSGGSKTGGGYEQYIELGLIREKFTVRFNTFQNDYTIADFYGQYNGKLFFDNTDEIVEIEKFGLENVEKYLDGNRLITQNAARKLREFSKLGVEK